MGNRSWKDILLCDTFKTDVFGNSIIRKLARSTHQSHLCTKLNFIQSHHESNFNDYAYFHRLGDFPQTTSFAISHLFQTQAHSSHPHFLSLVMITAIFQSSHLGFSPGFLQSAGHSGTASGNYFCVNSYGYGSLKCWFCFF